MKILKYPHPCLRRTSKPLVRVDAELRQLVAQMIELMYEGDGVGLAANQVGLPYRLFVANFREDPADKGQDRVFINPVIAKRQGMAEAEEGCLSLPSIYAPVRRPERVEITAFNLAGEEVRLELTDFPARVVQHETDHLDGVLFIDRLSPTNALAVRESLASLERRFEDDRQRGFIPDDQQIARELDALEKLRT